MPGWLKRWLPRRGRVTALLADASRWRKAGRLQEAENACRAAIAIDPRVAEAPLLLGNILREQGRLEEAMALYTQALALQPGLAMARIALGNLLNDLGKPREAGEHFLAAIAAKPDLPDAYANLGNSLQYLNRLDEAIACYRQAIGLDAGYVEAHHNLGNALSTLDLCEDACASFRAALALDPDYVESRWALTMSQLLAVYMDPEETLRRRAAFAEALGEMDRWFNAARLPLGARAVGVNQPFYLAYQEENNRELLARHGALCCRVMQDWSTRADLRAPAPRRSTHALRVGVVTEYFSSHSVWHAIVRGWFAQLNPSRFALHAFHLGALQDAETKFAKARAVRFEEGGRGLQQWAQAILDQQLDVLIYPNVGNDVLALRLASLRLAPVQVASWGHPETTGLPTLDYYLSAQDMEPPDGDANYVERLILLPHLGCHYRAHPVAPENVDLGSLGLDPDRPLLLCAGTPFKYAPQHDRVFVDIARKVPRGLLVFFEHGSRQYVNARLRQRLGAAFAAAGVRAEAHVAFVPWLERPRYYGLMRRATMLLDTIGFSGFNIAMQAVECGLPIVAWEGRFLRGRFASAILQRMGLPELVARNSGEYAAVATRLLLDAGFRDSMRVRILERRAVLFEDQAPIRELERFLLRVAGHPDALV